MKLFSIQLYVHLYSGRERRLSFVNKLSLKICNPLNFKSPTATGMCDDSSYGTQILSSANCKISEEGDPEQETWNADEGLRFCTTSYSPRHTSISEDSTHYFFTEVA